ncbi:hypothetical protein GCWU000341_02991 [Oribacterium sp. oral taxon 078 str. F0262]|nr:hypothetical protein GCWU000341_02991 [Oribacterium sp. oral taxon 078 str. F0262]
MRLSTLFSSFFLFYSFSRWKSGPPLKPEAWKYRRRFHPVLWMRELQRASIHTANPN